ncbi:glycoside hydrolase family 79 protein [Aplosporella prunicola CBS 121167]|uniref:Glycoside hydrolase family 79 protein n=1 Tax=Aplosporella prunicola CBS 121167 TaxID=1176127 RepID=A0A6A6B2G3_9PEZI|nr:glycoside hydrolase family 79 protein [Aplosporella prunicola CBS 121167]KAF2136921.1 glycoside hydrolase family 79 protein [Aplosporella prunicola CBS 121167]
MTKGVERVSMQLGINFKILAWQPITTNSEHPKAVHGNYYRMVFTADFIGIERNLKISSIPTSGHPNITMYTGYNNDKLKKIAVLNLELWDSARDNYRIFQEIELTGLGRLVKKVKVSRLTAPDGARARTGIT